MLITYGCEVAFVCHSHGEFHFIRIAILVKITETDSEQRETDSQENSVEKKKMTTILEDEEEEEEEEEEENIFTEMLKEAKK